MPLGNEEYTELADTGTYVIRASNKQIEIEDILISCDIDGAFITIVDSNDIPKSRKLFLKAGLNDPCEWAMNFTPGKDVTITASGGNVTIFIRFARK